MRLPPSRLLAFFAAMVFLVFCFFVLDKDGSHKVHFPCRYFFSPFFGVFRCRIQGLKKPLFYPPPPPQIRLNRSNQLPVTGFQPPGNARFRAESRPVPVFSRTLITAPCTLHASSHAALNFNNGERPWQSM